MLPCEEDKKAIQGPKECQRRERSVVVGSPRRLALLSQGFTPEREGRRSHSLQEAGRSIGFPSLDGPFQESTDGRTDLMGPIPDLLETLTAAFGLLRSEGCPPGRPPVGKGSLDPVKPEDEAQGPLGPGKHRKVRRPTCQGSRSEFHAARLKECQNPSEIASLVRVAEKGEGLLLQRLGAHLRYQQP